MLLDMYPKGPIGAQPYREGQDPFEIAAMVRQRQLHDQPQPVLRQPVDPGRPARAHVLSRTPERAPALNKIPLVKWHRDYAYASSTHMLLPRGLNLVYDEWGGEKASAACCTPSSSTPSPPRPRRLKRRQHYANSHEYRAYRAGLQAQPDLWCKWSEKYINWRQLEILG
jgi:hypothetical protein